MKSRSAGDEAQLSSYRNNVDYIGKDGAVVWM